MQARAAAVAILALLFVATLARADQCQAVDPDVVTLAATAIRSSHARVVGYCAPCGDPLPSVSAARAPRQVTSTGSSVVIDGVEVDLAYTYLETQPNVFENIALRTGCEASGVPEVLRFDNGPARAARFGTHVPAALRALGWGQPRQRAPLPLPG